MKDAARGENSDTTTWAIREIDMNDDVTEPDIGEQLERRVDEIQDYVEKNSPRPEVDAENAQRLLDEAPPAQAAEELQKMVDGFRSGAGAASGRNSMPAAEDPPTDELDEADPAPGGAPG
jgi:predicted metal-dependent hydrolase